MTVRPSSLGDLCGERQKYEHEAEAENGFGHLS